MISIIERPPFGFVVEGHGEYNCYRSLACRIVGVSGIHIPIVNAGGTGNIVRHLIDHLNDIVLTNHPCHILISVDLKDNIGQNYRDCEHLRDELTKQAAEWLKIASSNSRLQPLPHQIDIIIQIPKFESWILADINNLKSTGYVSIEENHINDVDNQILNPAKWLEERITCGRRLKDPRFAKDIISRLDPHVMRQNSKSFDKFFRETLSAYENWCQMCGIDNIN